MGRTDNDAMNSTIAFSHFDMTDVADHMILLRPRHAASAPGGCQCKRCERGDDAASIGKEASTAKSCGRGYHIGLSEDVDSTSYTATVQTAPQRGLVASHGLFVGAD
ncbi:MAG: hypothetical protein ACM3SP_24045 [Chloroflexota bacterium]